MRELDLALGGGFQLPGIIHLYGEPGTGKTTLGYHLTLATQLQGKQTLWFDFNQSFSLSRLKTIAPDDSIFSMLKVARLDDKDQLETLLNQRPVTPEVGLVVLDNFTHFYQLSDSDEKRGEFYHMFQKHLLRLRAAITRAPPKLGLFINQVRSGSDGSSYAVGGSLLDELARYVLRTRKGEVFTYVEVLKGEAAPKDLTYVIEREGWCVIRGLQE